MGDPRRRGLLAGGGRRAALGDLAPEMVVVHRDRLELADGRWARTFAVRGYPREVEVGWLHVLLQQEGEMRFAQHIEPVAAGVALVELGRDLRALQAAQLLAQARGAPADPGDAAAAEDAAALRAALARGDVQLFVHHLLVTVFGSTPEELDRRSAGLVMLLQSRMLALRCCLLEQQEGFWGTMPLARVAVRAPRNLDSDALSAALPIPGDTDQGPAAEVWGVDVRRRTLVAVDRFACTNPHAVCVAGSGAGKSYWLKHLLTQALLCGQRVCVLDADGEYAAWCAAVGGCAVRLGAGEPVGINPLACPRGPAAPRDAEAWQAVCAERLAALLGLLARRPAGAAPPLVWGALRRAQRSTSGEPTLEGFALALAEEGPAAQAPARLLAAALHGGLRPFAGATGDLPTGPAVVFDLRALVGGAPETVSAALLLLTHHILDRMVPPATTRLLLAVDEAHHLLGHAATARFLEGLFRSGRKRGVAVCLATQSIEDLLGEGAAPEAARAARGALANAATVFLMHQQHGRELEHLRQLYRLTAAEAAWLAVCRPGEGLLLSGMQRAQVRIEVPAALHHAFSTTPPGGRPP